MAGSEEEAVAFEVLPGEETLSLFLRIRGLVPVKGQLAGAAVEEEEELPPPSSLTFSTCETNNFQWLMGTCQLLQRKVTHQVVH